MAYCQRSSLRQLPDAPAALPLGGRGHHGLGAHGGGQEVATPPSLPILSLNLSAILWRCTLSTRRLVLAWSRPSACQMVWRWPASSSRYTISPSLPSYPLNDPLIPPPCYKATDQIEASDNPVLAPLLARLEAISKYGNSVDLTSVPIKVEHWFVEVTCLWKLGAVLL